MKGYDVPDGYMGYLPSINAYRLFSCESDYKDAYEIDIDTNTE